MKGRSFRSPVAGFSKAQKRGRSSWIICKVRRLGRRVKTLLYSVQTGDAQIMAKWPGANLGSGSQEQMSAQIGFGVDVKRGDFPP